MKDEKQLKEEILLGLDSPVPEIKGKVKAEYFERLEAKKKKKRNILLVTLVPAAAACAVLVAVLPLAMQGQGQGGGGGGSNSSNTGGQGIDVNLPLAPKHDALAFGAMSGTGFLSSMDGSTGSMGLRMALSRDEMRTHLEDVNPFMPTAEKMMEADFAYEADYLTYDEGAEYPYILVYEGVGGTMSLHYKETMAEYEDDEQRFHIEGYVEQGSLTYTLSGQRELESEEGEKEYETTFVLTASDGTRLVYSSEHEQEASELEVAYGYAYYPRGSVEPTLEVVLSYEREGLEEEMEIEVTTPGHEAEYLLSPSAGAYAMNLYYEIEPEVGESETGNLGVSISEDGTQYIYHLGDGASISLPRL